MKLANVSLADKYSSRERVFVTGIQALVRLPLLQRELDAAAGLNTAGYISGYRGSPLAAYDRELVKARALLQAQGIRFNPGINEDLALTSVWGSQQAEAGGEGRHDGVFAIWYGKGPGVDRSGDAFRHGNLAGASRLGGVLALLGDDHTCESSSAAHQSEYAMIDCMMPVLHPSNIQDIVDYGLYGWAMSRFSGAWVALKCVHDTVESSGVIDVGPERVSIALPRNYNLPLGGLNLRVPDAPLDQEERLHRYKIPAAQAFCRENKLDRIVIDTPAARLGIATTGKSYLDLRQALIDLGLNDEDLRRLGVRLYKVAMPWPLEPFTASAFCAGLELVIVIEEKRGLIEAQLKELLHHRPGAPRVIGKYDEEGASLFPSYGALTSNRIATELGKRLLALHENEGRDDLLRRLVEIRDRESGLEKSSLGLARRPHYCAGCPHGTSTRIPKGSRAMAGTGCSYMAMWTDANTRGFTQMGADGTAWIGEAPFSHRGHIFQNMGDGTYFHSGLLAIRATVAAGVNITYKILYNDAVAMTGGQPHDGPLSAPRIAEQVAAEGVVAIAVVAEETYRYRKIKLPPGTRVYPRDQLDIVQRQLREVRGTSVLIYDQTCAAEKRRRRKRKEYPDPPKRVFINHLVCEGCGDCNTESNCIAVEPLETEWGRKRRIDQTACNKDFSCQNGLCPSFVTVEGGKLRKQSGGAFPNGWGALSELPEPVRPSLATSFSILIAGVGGTGVITIGALLGMAAHLEGKGCSVLDMTGLAQKGGSVMTHVRIAKEEAAFLASRIAPGGADLILGCDILVAGREARFAVRRGRTHAVINTHRSMPGDFIRNPDLQFPFDDLVHEIREATGSDAAHFFPATEMAGAIFGDGVTANVFTLGYAYQLGLVPVSGAALDRAIELNNVDPEINKRAFQAGRYAAADPKFLERVLPGRSGDVASEAGECKRGKQGLEALISRRVAFLTDYQNAAYAARYRLGVQTIHAVEQIRVPGRTELSIAVAKNYFKILAYKDEYEVARLYTSKEFKDDLARQFDGQFKLRLHLAPPLLSRLDPVTGRPRKHSFGPWIFQSFPLLAKMRSLRGTWLDPFGYTRERRAERELIVNYECLLSQIEARLTPENYEAAVALAMLPDAIRGFGVVKDHSIALARAHETELLAQLSSTFGEKLKADEVVV